MSTKIIPVASILFEELSRWRRLSILLPQGSAVSKPAHGNHSGGRMKPVADQIMRTALREVAMD